MYRVFIVSLLAVTLPLWGQTYFGKNKIQFHRFRWQVLATPHFDIYFYPEMVDLAHIGAGYAEAAYEAMQNRLNHAINQRIPLVFYSSHFHFEETNTLSYLVSPGIAGFFEHIKGRVVIPCDGSLPEFQKTIQHEIVHVFQSSVVQRALRDHRKNVFRDVPLWFSEGLAEYWSEGWDSDAEMILRDGILNQTFVPIKAIHQIYGTYLLYKEGQSFVRYLARRYGEGILHRLMLNVWRSDAFSEVFELTVGEKLEDVGDDWAYALKKDCFPLLDQADLVGRAARRLTQNGYHSLPAVRPNDSTRVFLMANRDGYPSIYQTRWDADPEDSPRRIVRSEHHQSVESFHVMNSRIGVSAQGMLAFTAKHEGRDRLNLFDIGASVLRKSLTFDNLISLYSPAWSPDGQCLAFTGLDHSGRSDLYCYRLADSSLTRLTFDYADDRDPVFSPSGRYVAFTSDRGAVTANAANLYCLDLETRQIQMLTHGEFRDQHPAWSPDGRYLAFTSDRDGVPNLWLARLNASAVVTALGPLTQMATGALYPVWAGMNKLVFTGFNRFNFDLYALDSLNIKNLPLAVPPPNPGFEPQSPARLSGLAAEEHRSYRRRFSLDFAQSQISQDPIYGTGGGGQFFISDLLGDEYYHCLIYNNARTTSGLLNGFNVAVTRVDQSHRLNYALGLYRLAGRYYNRYEGYFYSERLGGMASLSYPLNKFERIETSLNVRRFTKDRYDNDPLEAFLLSNYLSYTRDNALWGATGPVDGMRFSATLGNTVDIQNAKMNFTTVMLDYRRYTRLTPRISHAIRLWGQFNQGREALPYTLGGSWDLRGYDLWSLWGTKLAFISNEIRFPLLDVIYLGFPFGGFGLQYIQGALFVDAGNAWEGDFGDVKGSFGAGIRFRFGGYLVLRLDVGRRTNFKTIESETFKQFFFGWDF